MNGKFVLPAVVAGVAAVVLVAVLVPVPVGGQAGGVKPGSPASTAPVTGNALPPPDPKFGGVINRTAAESKPWWPPRTVPPKGAPNVLLILLDDAGYGSESTFGGTIPTPSMDKLAREGLRYTHFHSASLCSPTRAALITGRNHHSVHFGIVAEGATGFPGYDTIVKKDTATLGTILRDNGYGTSWFGKNHNVSGWMHTQAGPFDQWPVGMGFEYFYGFLGGDANQWQPNLTRNTTLIAPYEGNPGWNLITAMADEAIDYMHRLNAIAPDKPFLVYYAPGATHAPHHPPKEWVEKFKGKFDHGWNEERERIFANQKRLGVIPPNAKLTAWPDSVPKWDTFGKEEQRMLARQAEVYAGYMAYSDYEIGRVIQTVEDLGKRDNTLIIYIGGDNGASPEGTTLGTPNEFATFNSVVVPLKDQMKNYDDWGSDKTFPHYAVGWAWAFGTPFKWTKQVASHFGGTRQGMVISWPARIKDVGGIRNQFHHVIDIVPTILEAAGIKAPETVDGVPQRPMDGVSMVYTFDKANANAPSTRKTQYFEMLAMRGIYHDGWMASTTPPVLPWAAFEGLPQKAPKDILNGYTWELYKLDDDPTQADDIAAKNPAKLEEMKKVFMAEAAKYNVLPLDNRSLSRFLEPKPSAERRPQGVHLHRRAREHAEGRRAELPRPVLHDHRRGGDSPGRRRRDARDRRRALRWHRLLSPQGQAGLRLQLRQHRAIPLGGQGRDRAGQAHARLRLRVRRDRLRARRTRHAEGGRQGGRLEAGPEDPQVHVPGGRDLRRRRRHAHADRRPRLPGAVSLHRQAQQADGRGGTDQGHARADPRVQVEDARLSQSRDQHDHIQTLDQAIATGLPRSCLP